MMMLPGIADGQKPSVNASVSASVAGSESHDGALLPLAAGDELATGAAVFASTVTARDADPAGELPVLSLATVVNVYAVPAVRPVITHDPDPPVTVHVLPPGDAVTTYEVGVGPPTGAVTVIVACSSPTRTVATPGVFGVVLARIVLAADADPAGELPDAVLATVVNVYAIPAVSPVTVHDPDAPVTVHVLPPGDAVTT
jgi:hypothetical protein